MPNMALIVVTGHLGQDMEVKYLQDGTPIGRFSLAVSTGYKDKKTTTWYRCSMFGKRAESMRQHMLKGRAFCVVGEPSAREWVGDNGVKHTSGEIRVSDVQFVDSRNDAQRQASQDTSTDSGMEEPAGASQAGPQEAGGFGQEEIPF